MFGKPAYSLKDHLDIVPVSVAWSEAGGMDFDLILAEVSFTDLLKRFTKVTPNSDGQVILDLNAPVTEDDTNCDYSGLSAAVKETSFMQKILDAQARRDSLS